MSFSGRAYSEPPGLDARLPCNGIAVIAKELACRPSLALVCACSHNTHLRRVVHRPPAMRSRRHASYVHRHLGQSTELRL